MVYKKTLMVSLICGAISLCWLFPEKSACEKLVESKGDVQAFPVCLKLAEEGELYAQNIVAIDYMEGNGIKKSHKEGVAWFQKAAEQGFSKAQSNLGTAYLQGVGVERDIHKANEWWHKAAAQGETSALHNLAISYSRGVGVNADKSEAAKYELLAGLSDFVKGNFKQAYHRFSAAYKSYVASPAKHTINT